MKRFINFIIDGLVFIVLMLALQFSLDYQLTKYQVKIISTVNYFSYYFISELIFGRTIGKLFTKTKVVSVSNKGHPSIISVFIRSIIRLIPLDIISFLLFKKGWHDNFSNTTLTSTK